MTAKSFDESQCRHPWERPVFFASMAFNLGLMAAAILLVWLGGDWLKAHPIIRGYTNHIRALAIAAVFAPPAIAIIRNIRHGRMRGNSVRLSPKHVPEIYKILESHCRKLGMDKIPDLYLTDKAVAAPAEAFSIWSRDYIGLNARFIERKPKKSHDVISFMLGCEIGRLRLGHTKWWYEMLLSYVLRIPYLRNPMLQVQILSHDRYGAYLESNFLPGLIILACGRRLLAKMDMADCLEQATDYGGFWPMASDLVEIRPHIYYRLRALIKAGLLDPSAEALKHEEDEQKDEPAAKPKKESRKGKEPTVEPALDTTRSGTEVAARVTTLPDPTKG